MNNHRVSQGFTLLELLIAISIFSVMATLAYGGLRLVLDGSQQIEHSSDGLASLQRAFLFIQQDLEQVVPRGVRDEYGAQEVAFKGSSGDKLLQLTRGGVNGDIVGGTNLRRVEYHLNDGRLERMVWSVLDRVQGSESSRLRLTDDVLNMDIRFMGDEESDWQNLWPSESPPDKEVLPRAVEIIITTEKFGAVSRLFVVGL